MTGYIFYDKPYGDLKGVSMTLVEDFAAYDHLSVSVATAEAFLTGASDIGAWTIALENGEPKLVSLADLQIVLEWCGPWELIEHPRPAPVAIVVRTGRTSQYVEITFTTQTEKMKLVSPQTNRMRFMFTRRGEPDAIVASLDVPIDSLSSSKSMVLQLQARLPEQFDLYTIPFGEVSYAVETYDTISPIIPYPAGRHDAIKVLSRKPPTAGLVVEYTPGQVTLTVADGGGPRYDVGSRSTVVAVCRRGDPDIPLVIRSYTTEEIEKSCDIDIGDLEFEEIDIYVGLLYRDAFFIDGTCKT